MSFAPLPRGCECSTPRCARSSKWEARRPNTCGSIPTSPGKHLGIVDYQTSGECAAGTGSFIDQQATRLLYSIEQVGPAACGASCAARIAGRCSVFAKTDMIHAQQKGYSTEQILRGLCDAVARNYKSSLVKGRAVVPPVAFIGGVAMNQGVRNALREAFKLKDADLLIPEHYAWLGAMGAAMLESEEFRKRSFKRIHQLRQHDAARKNFACTEPAVDGERLVAARPDDKRYGFWGLGAGSWRCRVAFRLTGLGGTEGSGVRCQRTCSG